MEKTNFLARRSYALLWNLIYSIEYRLSILWAQHGWHILFTLISVLIAVSTYFSPELQITLEPHFSSGEELQRLRELFGTLGGALTAASAIVFSLIIFAIQVNVERLPHRLFQKLGSDPKLFLAFISTFLLAVGIASLSLFSEKSWLAIVILAGIWGIVLILFIFLYAYRRTLSLINPLKQLNIVVENARKQMKWWERRIQRAIPFIQDSRTDNIIQDTHDYKRLTFFQFNPYWTSGMQQAITHSVSISRHTAETGDHEVSKGALRAVVDINAIYIQAKGKTFFANNILLDNPFVTDGFINESLEHLRQNVRIGITRGDEQQIENTFEALAALTGIYLDIDYSNEYASKTHAHLAAGYLSSAVQSVVPHNMPDVLMNGVRLMGRTAQLFLVRAKPEDIVTLVEKIAIISCAGIAKEDYRPVTQIGMEQIAQLTFNLIRVTDHEIRFAAKRLKDNALFVTRMFLTLPDTPLMSIHSTYLGPYYSGTNAQALQVRLVGLANTLLEAKADNKTARTVIRNIEQWAEDLHRAEKEIFLLAIEKQSHFVFDMMNWISQVTRILLAVSNAPACDEHTRDELRNHALWLISVLSFVPNTQETVTFVENFQMTETLFEVAMDAHHRDCEDVSAKVRDLLLSWAFEAGGHQTGWAILERSMYGLATLALVENNDQNERMLLAKIESRLAKDKAPNQEIRYRAAREIRERAATLYREGHWSSQIEVAMGRVDHQKLGPLLLNIANLLSPNTANPVI